ncbi:hypothetical protein TUA1478L_07160 [Lactiplantibacillus plantarum]
MSDITAAQTTLQQAQHIVFMTGPAFRRPREFLITGLKMDCIPNTITRSII